MEQEEPKERGLKLKWRHAVVVGGTLGGLIMAIQPWPSINRMPSSEGQSLVIPIGSDDTKIQAVNGRVDALDIRLTRVREYLDKQDDLIRGDAKDMRLEMREAMNRIDAKFDSIQKTQTEILFRLPKRADRAGLENKDRSVLKE